MTCKHLKSTVLISILIAAFLSPQSARSGALTYPWSGEFTPRWVDSQTVYFVKKAPGGPDRIYARSINGQSEKPVTPEYFAVGRFWVLPTRDVVFTAARKGTSQTKLYRWHDGTPTELLGWDAGLINGLHWDSDGTEILFGHAGRLFSQPLNSKEPKEVPLPNTVGIQDPQWSSTGKHFAYLGQFNPGTDFAFHLYVEDAELTRVWRLTTSIEEGVSLSRVPNDDVGSYEGAFVWSPDGTRIAYEHLSSPASEIWLADLTAKSAKRLVVGGYQPFWSRDGRSVFYLNENLDLSRVHVENLAVEILARGVITEAVLSPDGKRVAVTRKTGMYSSKLELLRL